MNCAVSAAHVVILMLWTSDCRAGDYRQLLYPARWGQSRLFSQTGCVGGLSGVTGLGGGGVGRVCGLVLAGSRTGCAMGLPRHAPSCLFGCGWWLAVVPRVCEKGRGTLVVSPPCEVWVRRRATLPHPSGCSTIAVPGLSFRVRNGSGRLPWAMAAANLLLSIPRAAPARVPAGDRGGLGTG